MPHTEHKNNTTNTPKDYPISVENMLLETGESPEYISFVNEMVALNNSKL